MKHKFFYAFKYFSFIQIIKKDSGGAQKNIKVNLQGIKKWIKITSKLIIYLPWGGGGGGPTLASIPGAVPFLGTVEFPEQRSMLENNIKISQNLITSKIKLT